MPVDLIDGQAIEFGWLAATTPAPFSTGYAELRAAVDTTAGGRDVATLTEVLWVALHGLTTLSRADRLRPGHNSQRLDLLVARFRAGAPAV